MLIGLNVPADPQKFYVADLTTQTFSSPLQLTITGAGIAIQIQLTTADSGPPGVFTVSGCASGMVISNDQIQTIIGTTPSSTCIITQPAPTSTTRYVFGGVSPSVAFESCSSGVCPTRSFTVYYQYLVTSSYGLVGGGNPPAPSLTFASAGSTVSATLSTTPQSLWIDSATPYSIANPLIGSTSTERWTTNGTVSGTVSSALSVSLKYYHQYSMATSYTIEGGGSPTPPTVSYSAFGAPTSVTLGTAVTSIWVDSGSTYALMNPLSGSTVNERWQTNRQMNGVATSPQTIAFAYYHQYLLTLSYSVSGGGSEYTAPVLTYVYSGATTDAPMLANPNSYWVDSGSKWNVSNPLPGSTSLERWETNSLTVYMVSSSGSYSFNYFNQFSASFGSLVKGAGTGYSPPTVNFTSLAHSVVASANASVWVDGGTTYSYPSILIGSTGTERWVATSMLSGQVVSHLAVTTVYRHQFYVDVRSAEPAGGAVSPSSGWYNATQTLTLDQSPTSGWRFEGWLGRFSGNANSTSMTVDAPINETAAFYPGVVIEAGDGGTVVYSHGPVSGSVKGGASGTVYVPMGTNVSLSASSSLFVYSFEGWNGASSSKSTAVSLIINSPESIEANFGYNYFSITSSSGAVVAVVAAVLFLSRHKKRSRGASVVLLPRTSGQTAVNPANATATFARMLLALNTVFGNHSARQCLYRRINAILIWSKPS